MASATRLAAAALCAALGVGLVAASTGADTAHASVFQSQAEGAAVGTFYTRPGTLPTGNDIVAASFGYSRSQVSILASLGLGAYIWLGDLASGYKETVALGAEAAPQSFKDALLSGPDYPFMAKARVPGSDADRSRQTSLTGAFEGQGGLVLEGGKAVATADSDASSGASTIAGLRLETPNQAFRNAMANLRQQISTITGRSVAATEPGVVLGAESGRTTSVSRFEGPRLVVSTTSRIARFSALEGLLQVSKVAAEAVSTSDGKTTSAKPRTTVSGVTVGPFAAVVDSDGVRVVDQSLGAGQLRAINDTLAQALGASGFELAAAKEASRPGSGTDVAFASAAALEVRLDVEKVYGAFRNRLPLALLQQAVAGDALRLAVGAASASAAVVPDAPGTPASLFDTGPQDAPAAAEPEASVLGERLGAAVSEGTETSQPGAPGALAAPASAGERLAVRPAVSVAYLGVPGWAALMAGVLMLAGGAALAFLGVWQLL